jgi:hypothetical protein
MPKTASPRSITRLSHTGGGVGCGVHNDRGRSVTQSAKSWRPRHPSRVPPPSTSTANRTAVSDPGGPSHPRASRLYIHPQSHRETAPSAPIHFVVTAAAPGSHVAVAPCCVCGRVLCVRRQTLLARNKKKHRILHQAACVSVALYFVISDTALSHLHSVMQAGLERSGRLLAHAGLVSPAILARTGGGVVHQPQGCHGDDRNDWERTHKTNGTHDCHWDVVPRRPRRCESAGGAPGDNQHINFVRTEQRSAVPRPPLRWLRRRWNVAHRVMRLLFDRFGQTRGVQFSIRSVARLNSPPRSGLPKKNPGPAADARPERSRRSGRPTLPF